MNAWRFIVALAVLPNPAGAADVMITGRAGYLSEWEITGRAHATPDRRPAEFTGPLVMKHIGLCATDGSPERTGEIRFRRIGLISSGIEATLTFGDAHCTFTASGEDTLDGIMQCQGTRGVPLSLKVNRR